MTETNHEKKKTIYCTIAAANYLPRVQVLRDSLRRSGHDDLRVLLIEHPAVVARIRGELPDYKIYSPEELGVPEWVHMAFYYNVLEYSTALKPAFIRQFLSEGNVVYLDPDIEVFSPLTEIEELLQTNDIVVTPHISKPLPEDGATPSTMAIIQLGQFNLGFLGVRSTPENRKLMDWWQSVLVEGARSDAIRGTFTDQFWAAILVSFATRAHILSSARYNLAYWNLPLHTLTWDGVGTPQTEDGPLGFYHYSGLDRANVAQVSKYQNRIRIEPMSPTYLLLTQYLNQIDGSPLAPYTKTPYSFDKFHNGQKIESAHQLAFLGLAAANRRLILNPFAEPQYMHQLVAASIGANGPQDPALALALARVRIEQLEQRLNSLPHSLFSHLQFVMDRIAPGSWGRMYHLMQKTSHAFGPRLANLRQMIS